MALAPTTPSKTPGGFLRVVSNTDLQQQEQDAAALAQANRDSPVETALAAHIRKRMSEMRDFRNTEGIARRLLESLRTYKGEYPPEKLAEIRKFQGSEVYARVTATKCRGATALLRDVYLGPDRPWDLDPTPEPVTPDNINKSIDDLVNIEVATLQQQGQPIDQQAIADRVKALRAAAARAAKKQAEEEADIAASKLDDILREGGFYESLAEFLIDLPIFPYACIKGPVVRRTSQTKWVNGQAQVEQVPKMFWYRVSPFDLYWSPGASCVDEAEFVERVRLTRAELRSLRGLPGYKDDVIDEVLERFSDHGMRDWWDVTDTERAALEDRERWPRTSTALIDTCEYHGSVAGSTLIEWGMSEEEVPDPLEEYRVQAWMIDRWVIKVQINPSPNQRAPYYVSNFEKIPGSMVGNGLPDLLSDVQDVSNATLRALTNNLAISSGPQVVVNDMVLSAGEDDMLYPWKRWHVRYDPMITGSQAPVSFFQPNSNADVLLGVYEKFSIMADEVSAIPRYMTGSERVGGAGRTASGLAMLMGNAAKTLQNVAATIDRDIIKQVLTELFNMVMLTSSNTLRGDEQIVVKGVNHAVKREQDRMRQLEFLQLTGNPVDLNIIGVPGRANILRSVAGNLGLDHEAVVPDDATLKAQMQAQQQVQQAQQQVMAQQSNQQPGPQEGRAGPEQVRQQTGVEGMFADNGRAGGGTPSGG